MSCWSKGPQGKSQTTQSIAKSIGRSPQVDDSALLLKITLIYFIIVVGSTNAYEKHFVT